MGMIWNTPATLDMINTVNTEFSTNIAHWRPLRNLFDHNNKGPNYELANIASNNGLYGGGAQNSAADNNWQTWLGVLGHSADPATSNHEKLRKAIYDGLDGTTYDLIMFQVVPLAHGNKIKITAYPDTDDRIMGVLIETPTFDQVAQRVVRVAAKKKAAKKKAAKKKAAKKKHQ